MDLPFNMTNLVILSAYHLQYLLDFARFCLNSTICFSVCWLSWHNSWMHVPKYGGRAWTLRALDSPTCTFKGEETIEEPLSLPTFIAGACRKVTGMAAITVLFDVQMSVPEFAPSV
jgi:hypothetical protein